jgi:predicted CXXCH cytochrome family protein
MRDLNEYDCVSFHTKTTLVGLTLLVFVGVFIVSCNEIEHHKMLTFFFEGVPPLYQDQLSEELVDSGSGQFLQRRSKQVWYVHQPRKDCTLCHDKSRQSLFSSQTYLIKPIPELCYECHADYTTSASYVHGPVAVGQCLLCHNPHRSRIEHLLKEHEPKLCYICHNADMINSIPAHLTEQKFNCTDCHNSHTSSVKYLLKEESLLTDKGAKAIEAVQNQIIIDSEKTGHDLLTQKEITSTSSNISNGKYQVFLTVSKLIEKGETKEAQKFLEKFNQSNIFSNQEWKKIIQVFNLIDKNNTREVVELYYRSMAFYYAGQLEKAKEGLLEVMKNKSTPPAVVKIIKDDLADIKNHSSISNRKREIAELYYRSMAFYRAGQFKKAREGLVTVLESGLAPAPMMITIKDYLTKIDTILIPGAKPPPPEK